MTVLPALDPPSGPEVSRSTNLVPERTRFVGRRAELGALERALSGEGGRLVTLLGPPGAGKTRLAKHAALGLAGAFAPPEGGGAWFCDATEARSSDELVALVAATLAVPLVSGASPSAARAQVGHALGARGRVLLVLDNVEQVVEAAASAVEAWLDLAPGAVMLATSRERLGVAGELCVELGPLDEPDAIELFLDRARLVHADVPPDSRSEPRGRIAALVSRLDHLPLAIELSAARANLLSPAQMLAHLEERSLVLRSTRRGAEGASRHRSLDDALDWSWELLPEREQRTLAFCSVFRGGFSFDAIASVLEGADGARLDRSEVLDRLAQLRDKSLVRLDATSEVEGAPPAAEARFSLYETVRAYAARKLEASGERARAETRHGEYYLALAERLAAGDEAEAIEALARERANMLAVSERAWSSDAPKAKQRAARSVLALEPLLVTTGPVLLFRQLVEQALSAFDHDDHGTNEGDEAARLRAELLRARAGALRLLGELELARRAAADALALARLRGFASVEIDALANLGAVARLLGEIDEAERVLGEALAALGRAPNPRQEGLVRLQLGALAIDRGAFDAAHAMLNAAREACRAAGSRTLEGMAADFVANVLWHQGRIARALEHYRAGVALHRGARHVRREGMALALVSGLLGELGRTDEALAANDQALAVLRRAGFRLEEATALHSRGTITVAVGRLDEAERYNRDALAIARGVGAAIVEGEIRAWLGVIAWERGDEAAAESHLLAAVDLLRERGLREREGLFVAFLGAALASRGALGEAERAFDRARALSSGPVEASVQLEVTSVLEALAQAASAEAPRDDERRGGVQRTLERVRDAWPAPRPIEIAVALRWLERVLGGSRGALADAPAGAPAGAVGVLGGPRGALADAPTGAPAEAREAEPSLAPLRVGPKGAWFEAPGSATRVELRRKPVLLAVFRKLVERRTRRPGAPVPLLVLAESAGPGEPMGADAAANRVYLAVRALRELGLRSLLLTRESGYLLDPSVPLERGER